MRRPTRISSYGSPLIAISTTSGTPPKSPAMPSSPHGAPCGRWSMISHATIPDVAVNILWRWRHAAWNHGATVQMGGPTPSKPCSKGAHAPDNPTALRSHSHQSSHWLPIACENGQNLEHANRWPTDILAGMAFNNAGLGCVHSLALSPAPRTISAWRLQRDSSSGGGSIQSRRRSRALPLRIAGTGR